MPTDEKPKTPPPAPVSGPAINRGTPTRDAKPYRPYEADKNDEAAFISAHWDKIEPIIAANPGYAADIRRIIWMYGQTDDPMAINAGIDALWRAGYLSFMDDGSSGSGSRGGGGGGGGSIESQVNGAISVIRNRARTLGLDDTRLNEDAIRTLAGVMVEQRWDLNQLDDYLVPSAVKDSVAGEITANVDQIKKLAAQQLLVISDASARELAGRISSSELDMSGVVSLLQTQAIGQYQWAAEQLGQGVTVRDMLLPARDRIAAELELAPESVDLMDPKYLSMVQTADENGKVRAATLGEVTSRARKDDRYKDTTGGKQLTAGMGVALQRLFTGSSG